ncbi:MAG: glycosyltransferase family 2 protein [Planctomycetaceae bacterium]|nr:MAG: glycosyltransferase family 2 protein [Planctomycetaceae bacterium]
MRSLTALPVFNEVGHVTAVLDRVALYSSKVLVVDDGSTDGTAELLDARADVVVVRHKSNRGYGAALQSAFRFARQQRYDVLVTIDCDGQHEPQRIPEFVRKCDRFDIVSGSRYLEDFADDSAPPEARWRVNQQITHALNQRLGLSLTDAFCGFKAYRVEALRNLDLSEPGYAMPLELWVQAVAAGLRIVELPVPRIYLDESRSFGGSLDDAQTRLRHYYQVIERSMRAFEIGDQKVQQPLYAASF